MALLLPHYLDTVAALGTRQDDGDVTYFATGFLVGWPNEPTNDGRNQRQWLFLVTNRHVADRADDLVVRLNRSDPLDSYILPLPKHGTQLALPWTVHPDQKSDIAVCLLNVPGLQAQGSQLANIHGVRHVLTQDEARDIGIGEGDGVFVLGFPLGIVGEDRNQAIVRQGVIARMQGWLNGNEDTFLIDASIYPGNSGGPVFTKPESAAIVGTKSIDRCALIGMVSSYLPYREEAVSRQTGVTRMLFEENSGLGVVVPINLIAETIEAALASAFSEHGVRPPTSSDSKSRDSR